MEVSDVIERLELIAAERGPGPICRERVEEAMIAEREVRSWLDAANAALVSKLSATASFPESAVAAASRCSQRDAHRAKERADTLDQTVAFASALDEGKITVSHVDAIARGARRVDAPRRAELFDRLDALVDVARAATPEQFERRVRREVKRIESDGGTDRLERHRRLVRMSNWIDDDGMWCVRGRFDPLTGVRLSAALDCTLEALFAEVVPAHAPTDPVEKQRFLRAHAFARMTLGDVDVTGRPGRRGHAAVGRSGRPEYVVVIDVDGRTDDRERGEPSVTLAARCRSPTSRLAATDAQR